MSDLHQNLQHVRDRIAQAANSCGRNPKEIQLLAVSKTHPAETVRMAYQHGCTWFGENRVQEAESKINDLNDLNLEWHLVGPLQTNKVKKALNLFHCIQTVDRIKLARTLEKEAEKLNQTIDVLIQVNIGREEQKAGVSIEELPELMNEIQHYRWLR